MRLALRKARAVAAHADEGIVLAADTLVVVDGVSLGKPSDQEDARAMLRRLSGRPHQVITGVAVVDAQTGGERSAAAVSRVFMRELSAAEIDAYVPPASPATRLAPTPSRAQGGRLVAALLGSYTTSSASPPHRPHLLAAAASTPRQRRRRKRAARSGSRVEHVLGRRKLERGGQRAVSPDQLDGMAKLLGA